MDDETSNSNLTNLEAFIRNNDAAVKILLKSKDFNIIDFINSDLNRYFTSSQRDPFLKQNAVKYILAILKKLKPHLHKKSINANKNESLDVLLNFLIIKIINDSHIIWGEILTCIYTIFHRFETFVQLEQYSIILSSLMENIHAQSLDENGRLYLFKTLFLLIKNHPCNVKKLGSNFIEKYRDGW